MCSDDKSPYEGEAFNSLPKAQVVHDLALLKLQTYIAEDKNFSTPKLVQKYVDYCTEIVFELDKLPK